jgi:4-hydroxy-tetrahydrodipicolinate synthase
MRGVWTALVTPFNQNNELDLPAFRKILQDQKAAKVSGVIPCGTTGESPTLSLEERKTLITTAIQELKGSGVQVFAGTGTNNTRESIELSSWAALQGVDGVLIVTPYYNKPSQAGLISHFTQIAEAVNCEVMLYNVPGRTGVSLTTETILNLAKHPKIRTLKEATGNVAFTSEILDTLAQAGLPLDLLSGDDATFLPLLSVGAVGIVSVSSNIIPKAMVELYAAASSGDLQRSSKIHRYYYPLFRDLFIDSNPGPIKYAMEYMGRCSSRMREPLAALSPANLNVVKNTLIRCGIGEKK